MGRRRGHHHHHSHTRGGARLRVNCNGVLAHFCRPIDPTRLQPRTRHVVAGVLILIAITLFGLGIGIIYMARTSRLGSCCFPAGCNVTAISSARLPIDTIDGICVFSMADTRLISCPGADWSNLNSRCMLQNEERCTTTQLSRLAGSVPGFAFTTGILLLLCATIVGGLCNACSTDMRSIVLILFTSLVVFMCLAATLIHLLSGWNGNPVSSISTMYSLDARDTEATFIKKQAISSTAPAASCPFSNTRLLLWNTEGSVALGLLGTAVALAALLVLAVLGIIASVGRCTGSCGGDGDVSDGGGTSEALPQPTTTSNTTTTLAAPILVQPTFVEQDERPWYEKQRCPNVLDQTTITLTPSKTYNSSEPGPGLLHKTDSILLSFPSRSSHQQEPSSIPVPGSGANQQGTPLGTQNHRYSAPSATTTTTTTTTTHPYAYSSWDEPSYSPSYAYGGWDMDDF